MSKYRIEIAAHSELIDALYIVWVLVLLASIWSWKQDVIVQQVLLQAGLSALVFGFLISYLRGKKTRNTLTILLLNETGELVTLPDDGTQWHISDKSKLVGPFLYLHIIDRFSGSHSAGQWVARDQFDDNDFRRLCRVVCRCQRSQKMMTE